MLTIDQYIASISGLAALATALATFLTVREIAKQRRSALVPDLASSHQFAYVYAEQPLSGMRYVWSADPTIPPQLVHHSRYGISLVNVGTGAAKQLQAKWALDLEGMVVRVNELARSASVPVSADMDSATSEVRILWADKVFSTGMVANQLKHDLGHVLPASLDKNGLHVEVPSVYLHLAALQVALGLVSLEEVAQAEDWARFPHAVLSLNYIDVLGDEHSKELEVSFQLLSAGHQSIAHEAGQLPTFMQFYVKVHEA